MRAKDRTERVTKATETLPDGKIRRICGVKNKAGTPCRRSPMFNGRCYLHGGMNTGPKNTENVKHNALKHGIYSNVMSLDDMKICEAMDMNSLDSEIKALRIRLLRALQAQAALEERVELDGDSPGNILKNEKGLEVAEVKDIIGPVRQKEITRKRPDYRYEINRLSGRIADLMVKNKQLAEGIDAVRDNDKESRESIIQSVLDTHCE